jgi:sodium-dependent dicarboxylate transporter 2/3/5
MLGIAYAATIGGMSTLVGTPTNVLFRGFVTQSFPQAGEVSFLGWMLLGVPLAVVFLVVTWMVLSFITLPLDDRPLLGGRSVLRQQVSELGPMRPAEWRVLAIFLSLALLWVFREPVPGMGWAVLLGYSSATEGTVPSVWVDDGTIAMSLAILCFVIPSGDESRRPLLTWDATRRLPWGIVFLFGGGFALAKGMDATGLDEYLGSRLAQALHGHSPALMAIATTVGVTYFSEITSNIACLMMVLPIVATTATSLGMDPFVLMIPATFAASCGFMLPVATPPNSIVYSSGRISSRDMVKAGFLLDMVGIVLVVGFVWLLGPRTLGVRW